MGRQGPPPLGKRRNVLYVLEKDVKLYRKYADYNFAMLEEILKLADERGFDVVLYDQPLNASAAGPDWNGVVPAYRKRARALAARYDVPYVHIERNVEADATTTSPTSSTCSRRAGSSGSRRWRGSWRPPCPRPTAPSRVAPSAARPAAALK